MVGLKLGIVGGKLSFIGFKLSQCTLYNLLSDLIQGALLLKNFGLDGFYFGVKFIGEFGALIGKDFENLETSLDLIRHLRDHLDHLLFNLLLILVNVRVASSFCCRHYAEYYYLIIMLYIVMQPLCYTVGMIKNGGIQPVCSIIL